MKKKRKKKNWSIIAILGMSDLLGNNNLTLDVRTGNLTVQSDYPF
jgi:hypothetical protein